MVKENDTVFALRALLSDLSTWNSGFSCSPLQSIFFFHREHVRRELFVESLTASVCDVKRVTPTLCVRYLVTRSFVLCFGCIA